MTHDTITEIKEPMEEDFDIPTTEESYERMVECFASIGLEKWETDKAIKNKRTVYNRAFREYKKLMEKRKKSEETKSNN